MPLTSSIERFDTLSRVFLKHNGKARKLNIEYYKPYGDIVILKFHEINSKDDADSLRGAELMIPREESPRLPDSVFYYYQIIGLDVFTTEDLYIGKVADIIETGSNDVYVVKTKAKTETKANKIEREKEYLIPAIGDVIKDIDIKNSKIIIAAVEGLLE